MKRLALIAVLLAGCGKAPDAGPVTSPQQIDAGALHAANLVTSEQPPRAQLRTGHRALSQYGCISCHEIPGMIEGTPAVGPPLSGMARRRYIAGVLPNTPANLARWIEHPQQVDPLTAMPDLGVDDAHAQAMAAYLYAHGR